MKMRDGQPFDYWRPEPPFANEPDAASERARQHMDQIAPGRIGQRIWNLLFTITAAILLTRLAALAIFLWRAAAP